MCIKVGFVQPTNSTGLPDFGTIYNALVNPALAHRAPVTVKDNIGIVMVEIYSAKDLPKWPNSELFDFQRYIAADRTASDSHGLGYGPLRKSLHWRRGPTYARQTALAEPSLE